MSHSPGHQQWPDHKVEETHLRQPVTIEIGGQVVARSDDVIRVDEDQHPSRYYFPRDDVRMAALQPSDTTSKCPFKGTAHYFDLKLGDRRWSDAVWTYEEPYDEHHDLKDRLAFYSDRYPEIHLSTGNAGTPA